jgi:trehalose 2-sulfotransferase
MGLLKKWGLIPPEPNDLSPPSKWTAPKKTCLIASIERTGSSLLSERMRETGVLGYPSEYFNKDFMKARRHRRRISAVGQAWYAMKVGSTDNGVTSIKFLPGQFRFAKNHLRFEEWFPNAFWVTTRRKDRLGQAISFEIASQTQAWNSQKKSNRTPIYSTAAILARIEQIDREEVAWASYFEAQNIRPLHLWYEDLDANLEREVEKVFRFLGQDPSDSSEHVQGPERIGKLQRQRGALNSEWRERFLDHIGALPEICGVTRQSHPSENKLRTAG